VVSGGIAAFKACVLARELGRAGHTVRAVLTEAATRFVTPLSFEALTGEPAFVDLWEPRLGSMEHIDLARWADAVVGAPATADLLARMAQGLADDLATTCLLAFEGPVLVAPAMNPSMFAHPATRANLETLRSRGVTVAGPASGDTACGEEGPGRMVEPDEIAAALAAAAPEEGPLSGKTVLITLGPTREHLDPARFLSNPSTGAMGLEVARAARRRGARVVLVRGPMAAPPEPGCEEVLVVSAAEMADAVRARLAEADVFVATAAVADWTPASAAGEKQAKVEGPLRLELVRTEDILRSAVEARRAGQVMVGFAAETHDVLERAEAKRARKGVDLLVANQVGGPGTGFGGDRNRAALLEEGREVPGELRETSKAELAEALMDRVVARMR